ncbi:MAG TPA: cation:proton antiporter [Bacteroidales bacterium]|nr:cation:proton antiporter [Bacteroidales bacterium]
MIDIFFTATLWLFLAVLATVIANKLKISMALIEICVGALAGYLFTHYFTMDIMKTGEEWIRFVASTGAILLTFLAGTEIEPSVLRSKRKEVVIIGILGFLLPFSGAAAVAKYILDWNLRASLLTGIALSTTSMAVVYAVMLEYGFNKTEFGKGILGACFINDLGTVIALGLIFAPFTFKTIIFVVVCLAAFLFLPSLTQHMMRLYAFKTAAIRTKWVLFILFLLGFLALWAGSEAVLPAYIVGIVLATTLNKDDHFIRRLRTLTIGFLTPIYFIRAGALVSLPALVTAPLLILILFGSKVIPKMGLFPVISRFRSDRKERWYYTLLMSTGLTFGTISAIYGLTNGIITENQYSYIVAVVIGSAVIPTVIANFAFLPSHLLKIPTTDEEMLQLDNGAIEQTE